MYDLIDINLFLSMIHTFIIVTEDSIECNLGYGKLGEKPLKFKVAIGFGNHKWQSIELIRIGMIILVYWHIGNYVMVGNFFIYSCCSCAMSCICWIVGIALVVALAIGLGVYFGIFHGANDPETDEITTNILILRLNETIKASYK